MPSPTRTLTAAAARQLIAEWSFPEVSGDRVGVEIEWFSTPSSSPPAVKTLRGILDPVLPLPRGSGLTFEPGGQVELSSAPFVGCDQACEALTADAVVVRGALADHGIGLTAGGLDPARPDRIVTDEQRYVAMKAYFDQGGAAGRRMMSATASVHVNVDAGADHVGRRRWRLAHQLGPTLVAAFADSPIVDGRPSGWMSARMAAWLAIDATRTAPVENGAPPAVSWATYALRANVMFIRTERFVPLAMPFPFERWLDEGHELGYPTSDDLAYHLTTLFPPVRPHGWLELRMIDMVPDPWWRVAAAVTTALLYDPEAADTADTVSAAADGLWAEAARSALRHPLLHASARGCFDAALAALGRIGCDPITVQAVAEYTDRFVRRGRCPADERLEAMTRPSELKVAEAI
jgi:glutamate--cysteine ligase